MLNEKETIKKMKSLGFEHVSYTAWEFDSNEHNFASQVQFAPFESNFSLLKDIEKLYIKKFYIVKLSNGFEIRAWGMYTHQQ